MAGNLTAAPVWPSAWHLDVVDEPRPVGGPAAQAPVRLMPRARPIEVLVVDDEQQIVDLLCLLLEDEGYRALRAYDGAQAWEVIRSRSAPPDVVITDVMMPRMSGLQLAQRLKERYHRTCPPVIVTSAVSQAPSGPGVRFLPKPFDIDRVLDLVSELTQAQSGEARGC